MCYYNAYKSITFTLGLRQLSYKYNQYKEDWEMVYGGSGNIGTNYANANKLNVSSADEEINYRMTVAWEFSDVGQVYLTSLDATRPGGGNRSIPRSEDPVDVVAFACNRDLNALNISGSPTSYQGDSVTNTEVGLKVEPNNSLRVNVSAYRIDWTDIQQRVNTSGICGFNFTANLGEAISEGIEIDLTAAIVDGLVINAGLGYTDATFSKTVASVSKGDLIPDVPEFTASISADWEVALSAGDIFMRASISYVDDTLELAGSQNTNTVPFSIESGNVKPAYTLVDLRVGFASRDNWEVSVFVDNLTDEEAIFTYSDAIVFNLEKYDRTVRNRPRTLGLSAQYEF